MARPDEWAVGMDLKVDGKPFSLEGREYIRQVIRDYSPEIIIPKAAQMAFTVTFLTKSLHNVAERRLNGLYLLPLKTGAVPFVQARIDPIIESNAALSTKFASVDNRLHKQSVDGVNFYIRGTNILRELQEVPVDFEVWDERDHMVEENLPDARHRMDGSHFKRLVILSTPTVDGYGVYGDDAWEYSDQHRFEIPCPGCGRFQVLNFTESSLNYSNLKLGDTADECVLECAFCHREISDQERPGLNKLGRWTPMRLDGKIRGYHISQFNSPTQPLREIMSGYFKGLRDQRIYRSFWNQNMGLPFTAAGDRVTPELLDKCRQSGYLLGGLPNSSLSIGIDVGTTIHCWCWHFGTNRRKMLWNIKMFRNWSDLDKFLSSLNSWVGVIDAHPEKSKSYDLAQKYHGRLWIGFSDDRPQAHEMANYSILKFGEPGYVTIDKTMALDNFIRDMIDGNVILPPNARDLGEEMRSKPYNGLYHQLTQMVRVEEENLRGNVVARWRKNRNADHWHHAGMFATVAALQAPQLHIPSALASAMNRTSVIEGA
jgi:Phage terminase large subunit gpA, ATPase domain